MEHLCFPPQPGSVPWDNQFNVFKLPELCISKQSSPIEEVDDVKTLCEFRFVFNPLVFSKILDIKEPC